MLERLKDSDLPRGLMIQKSDHIKLNINVELLNQIDQNKCEKDMLDKKPKDKIMSKK
ncbi:MAG: hypothetical protein U9N59_00590 [Campylobacterota bacterium]|nr:hypothetical protein [Campylobacterota bacterium]